MASKAILEKKQLVIDEIKNNVSDSKSIILFDYRGMTDAEAKELRIALKNEGSDYKIYKNTLMSRAFNDLGINLEDSLAGPSALAYSNDQVAAVKVLAKFAKTHPALSLKVGVIDGEIADKAKMAEYAALPSRDALLTMLAGSMIGIVKDLSISLDLYSQQLEEKK